MKRLIENLYQHIVPVNEGYDYIFSDTVYVPIYETSLLVTKRTVMPISLVEEKVLQLLDIGVFQINEIAQILGLERKLLDVTLADLYSKDLVSVSSSTCKMMLAGKDALNQLNRTEKKQDILKNVCIDGILGNVIDTSEYELQNKVWENDGKLKPMVPIGDVKSYMDQFKKISQIFDEENVLYFSEGVQPIKEELLKIDKIDSTFVKYIKIPLYVYVSSNGTDIDIVPTFEKQRALLDSYKDYIIDQINNKRVLRKHFKYRKISPEDYSQEKFVVKDELFDELKSFHFSRKKDTINYDLIAKDILCTRKLLDGEYRDILKYIVMQQEKVKLYINNLDDWAFDTHFTGEVAEDLGKVKVSIYYAKTNSIQKARNQIDRNFKGVERYVNENNPYFICWQAGQYLLYGIPRLTNVIDDNTTCLCIDYYLKDENEKNSLL